MVTSKFWNTADIADRVEVACPTHCRSLCLGRLCKWPGEEKNYSGPGNFGVEQWGDSFVEGGGGLNNEGVLLWKGGLVEHGVAQRKEKNSYSLVNPFCLPPLSPALNLLYSTKLIFHGENLLTFSVFQFFKADSSSFPSSPHFTFPPHFPPYRASYKWCRILYRYACFRAYMYSTYHLWHNIRK